jgi:hypothetical protein
MKDPMSGTPAQARIAALSRHRPRDDPELVVARRDFWAEEIADHIAKVVSEAPPLTDAQVGKIVSILTNAPRGVDTR